MSSGDPQPWFVVEALESYLTTVAVDTTHDRLSRLTPVYALSEDELANTVHDRRFIVSVKLGPYPKQGGGAACIECLELEVAVAYGFTFESRRVWLADSRILDRALREFRVGATYALRSKVTPIEPDVTAFDSGQALLQRWRVELEYHVEA